MTGRTDAAAERGARHLASLQHRDGHWEGEVVWCPVITAQVVIARAVIGAPLPAERAAMALLHFARVQRSDGGWGMHPESNSYLFVTTLVYVAARLLGSAADSPLLRPASSWLSRHPEGLGALPSWGRFWLSLIGLYDRSRITNCPPELFLLPSWMSIAPDRFYCHTRYIYLGMAYLGGCCYQADLGAEGIKLAGELAAFYRPGRLPLHRVAHTDLHVPPGRALRLVSAALRLGGPLWRRLPGAAALRRRALARCLSRIRAEQRGSAHQALSPVNGVLNVLALHAAAPGDPDIVTGLAGLDAWCWSDAQDGLRHAGARSVTWDTAFALQALAADPAGAVTHAAVIRRGCAALLTLQVTGAPSMLDRARQLPTGGWCFGGPAHNWPVGDCTAEAIVALLLCRDVPGAWPATMRLDRLRLAVDFVLARQNADGGFATYERRRGGRWLERVNPSEMFGQCMTELSYVECTASAIRALHLVATRSSDVLPRTQIAACRDAVSRGRCFLLGCQRPDGAWPGFWGINQIYGTSFCVTGLCEAGLPTDDPAIARAGAWLRSVQREDGGWGEHFSGCLTNSYVPAPRSLVAMTSWAILALLRVGGDAGAAWRGLEWLANMQCGDGNWPRDSVNGAFFGTAMLDYRLYNSYFPVWALARGAALGFSPRDALLESTIQ